MKNAFVLAGAFFLATVTNAQTTPATQPATPVQDTATVSYRDTSIGKAYVTNPERFQGLTSETLTPSHVFPALGSYTASGTSTASITISLDETNKGIVWVDGLPQGRFKALMKKSPAVYKVPAQKSESGQSIAEGTLYLNPETNELTILLGRSFNDADPTSAFTNVSKKTKVWQYTGIKADAQPTSTLPASQNQ
ncbi:hypothetical protein HRH25_01595 [Flavisolibacter sp. BT320]|nr:hypothetical protein [Flavisolibacter longurius]